MRERYLSRTAVERELAISARDRRERAGRARAAPGAPRAAARDVALRPSFVYVALRRLSY